MKQLFVIIGLIVSTTAFSQRIQSEKIFRFRFDDYFYKVISIDSGRFMAVGESHKFGTRSGSTLVPGAIFAILDSTADTLQISKINNIDGGGYGICKGDSNTVYIFINGESLYLGYYIARVTYGGDVISVVSIPFVNNGGGYQHMHKLPDGSLLLTGWDYTDRSATGQRMRVDRKSVV